MSTFIDEAILLAIREDLGPSGTEQIGDVTSQACISNEIQGKARVLFKESGVVCGHGVSMAVLKIVDSNLKYVEVKSEGERVSAGEVVAEVVGSVRSILTAERTLLNFFQRLSGVATLTREVVEKVQSYKVNILDTRKTTPTLRSLEKYAVKVGGGTNHRMGLYDEFLIKNNHIDALGGDVAMAVARCKTFNPNLFLKVEVRNRAETKSALDAGAKALLLDNFSVSELIQEVEFIRGYSREKIRLEASGGITPLNVVDYAATGVDEISLGFITHSVKALDISLRLDKITQ